MAEITQNYVTLPRATTLLMKKLKAEFSKGCARVGKSWEDIISRSDQGCTQDQVIASHTCFGGHMDVNC